MLVIIFTILTNHIIIIAPFWILELVLFCFSNVLSRIAWFLAYSLIAIFPDEKI